MRALRPYTPARFGVRVNTLAPWATDTQLLAGVRDEWVGAGMPINTPEEVARVMLQAATDPGLNGRGFFVGGGRCFDVEGRIDELRPQWMGSLTAQWERGQEILALVSFPPKARLGRTVLASWDGVRDVLTRASN